MVNHPLTSCVWLYYGLKGGVWVLKEVSASSSLPSKLTTCCDSTRSLGCPCQMLQVLQPPWQRCQPGELPAAHSAPLDPAQPDPSLGLTPLHPVALLTSDWKPVLIGKIVIMYLLFKTLKQSQFMFRPLSLLSSLAFSVFVQSKIDN